MSRYPGKKLPPHWVYIPSRREVSELLKAMVADVRRVDLDGTGFGARPKRFTDARRTRHGENGDVGHAVSLLLGYVEHRVVEGAWCFYLRLWGVPESAVEGHRDELASASIHAIKQSIEGCLALPASETVKPTQLLLRFELGSAGTIPECSLEVVGSFSFSSGIWWETSRS